MMNTPIIISNRLHFSSIVKVSGLFALSAILAACLRQTNYENNPLTSSSDLERLDPTEVVRLYWASALVGDTGTIRQIVGKPGQSLLWECKPKQVESNSKGTIDGYRDVPSASPDVDESGVPGASIDNMDSILLRARTIATARKQLDTHFDRTENKTFGREAMLTYRPKDSPNPYNSTLFFLLHDGSRWRIIDITDEDYFLKFVGNKKFGEERSCPPDE